MMRGQTEQPHRLTPVGFAPPQEGSWGSQWSCLCSTQEGSGLGQGADEASLVAGVGVCTPSGERLWGPCSLPCRLPGSPPCPLGSALKAPPTRKGLKTLGHFSDQVREGWATCLLWLPQRCQDTGGIWGAGWAGPGSRGEEGADPWQELPWGLGKAGSGFPVQQESRIPSPGEWSPLPFFLPRQPPGQSRGLQALCPAGSAGTFCQWPQNPFLGGLGLGSLRLCMTFVWAPCELWRSIPPGLQ